MKKEVVIEIAIAVVLVALALSIYFGFFHFSKCADEKCFSNSLVKCDRVVYYKDTPSNLMSYKILGASSDECPVSIKLVQVKEGSMEMLRFEGEEMTCTIPLGTFTAPESNLRNCEGKLREDLQEAIIDNMHSQIVQNLDGISTKYVPLNNSVNSTK